MSLQVTSKMKTKTNKVPRKFNVPATQVESISDNLKKTILEAGFPGDTGDWKLFKDVIYSTSTDVQVL
jgi:hypothetical protein